MAADSKTEDQQSCGLAGGAPPLAIVGVAASAASLPSLERLFTQLPKSTGLAYVVAIRSRDDVDASRVAEALAERCGRPAQVARDGAVLEADRIFVGDSNAVLSFSGGGLKVSAPQQGPGGGGVIDTMLASLAEHQARSAIAVVLAGLESDGVRGVAAVKEAGGLALAEAPADGAVEAVSPEGMVAPRLAVERLPERILAYACHLSQLKQSSGTARRDDQAADQLPRITTILRNRTGHDFAGDEPGALVRSVQRRMHVVQAADLDAYEGRLRDEAGEVDNLLQDLLRRKLADNVGRQAERITERHAPSYVIVDPDHEVLHFSGRTGRYLEHVAGAANLNLLNLIHPDLRLELRAALRRVQENGQPAMLERMRFTTGGESRAVTIVVEPLSRPDDGSNLVVLFQEVGSFEDHGVGAAPEAPLGAGHVRRLEADLRLTQDRLQDTIKELQTVNSELAHRVSELGKANSDLKNLLESTQIATVFLDKELRVRAFTPVTTELFHFMETDIGRPIGHIASRLDYPELQDDVRKVLSTLGAVHREVRNPATGASYLARVLPYRSIDDFIGGAVLTFLDVTATTRAEEALRKTEAHNRLILESATDYAIITTDLAGVVTGWNPGARELLGWSDDEIIGRPVDTIFTVEDREAAAPEDERRRAQKGGRAAGERWHVRKDGSRFWGAGMLTPMRDRELNGFLKILRDCTTQRMAEDRQKLLLSELQHRVRNILAVVRSLAMRTAASSETLEDFASHFDGRLTTLSRTQNVFARTGDVMVDLEEMVRDELLALAAGDEEQVEIAGPSIKLREQAAETFALALHELATNAVKYGALATANGKVSIQWRLLNTKGGQRLWLEWRESGVVALDLNPGRSGFGRELIERGLPYELGAATSLTFEPGGVRALIELPINEDTAVAPAPAKRKVKP